MPEDNGECLNWTHNSSVNPQNNALQKQYRRLLVKYQREKQDYSELQKENLSLREDMWDLLLTDCYVCFNRVLRNRFIYMGKCGHYACSSCFVESVAHAAVQINETPEFNSLLEEYRCFYCRTPSTFFSYWQEDRLVVKRVEDGGELGDKILQRYSELVTSLALQDSDEEWLEEIVDETQESESGESSSGEGGEENNV